MEVKNYFATDTQGNVLGSAQVYLYLAGTTTLATGLQNISGASLANPFTSDSNGLVQFMAPDNNYDLRVVKPGREFTIRIQCFDGIAFKQYLSNDGSQWISFEGKPISLYMGRNLPFASYAEFSAYNGAAESIEIMHRDYGGSFVSDGQAAVETPDGGVILLAANGKNYRRIFSGAVKQAWYDVQSNGFTSTLKSAVSYVGGVVGGGVVEMIALDDTQGDGSLMDDIRSPNNVKIKGQGIGATVIKMHKSVIASKNSFTNALNTNVSRTTLNKNIEYEDFTIDSNWQERDPSGTVNLNDQGCGIKLAGCENSHVRNVHSKNAPLHCFDICASIYLNDGNINSQPDGMSFNCSYTNCTGTNPQRDDAFTCHNSKKIGMTSCNAVFVGIPGSTQQGFEVDEGSIDVKVSFCRAENFQKGFQAKGHDTTIPAVDVLFSFCTAQSCTYGFEASHLQVGTVLPEGQIYWARDVVFDNCISRDVKPSTTYAQPKDLSLTGYIGTTVKNFTVYGTRGIITIDKGADVVNIKGVKFKDGSILAGISTGRIHCYAPSPSLPNGQNITIEDVICETAIGCPLIRATSAAAIKRIKNIRGFGTDANIPLLSINIGSQDSISELSHTGFLCALLPTSNAALTLDSSVKLEPGLRYYLSGAGTPQGVKMAPMGAQYVDTSNGSVYRNTSNANMNGWVAM